MRAARIAIAALPLLTFAPSPPVLADPAPSAARRCLVEAAREQVGVTVRYDGRYVKLAYPGGDVPADRGACTDVVVRAYRRNGLDLQRLVHEDMSLHWDAYPKLWGLTRPDANIDHRRVPNLAAFFTRHGEAMRPTADPKDYLPGDVVTWRLPSGVPHVGIVSLRRTGDGRPLVIHNIGAGAAEEDMLLGFAILGHYRWLPPELASACSAAPSR